MTIIASAEINPAGLTVIDIFKEEDGRKFVEDGYYLVALDGRHWPIAVLILNKTAWHPWTVGQIQMPFIMREDVASTKQTAAIKQRKVYSTSSVLVWKDPFSSSRWRISSTTLVHLNWNTP